MKTLRSHGDFLLVLLMHITRSVKARALQQGIHGTKIYRNYKYYT